MKKSAIVIDLNGNTATASKSFLKKASIFGTPEYEIFREFRAQNPDVQVVAKTIKKNPDKKTYRNMTYKKLREYITVMAPDMLSEMERQIKVSKIQENPYRAVLAWFIQQFPDYDKYKEFWEDEKDNAQKDSSADAVSEKDAAPELTLTERKAS